MFMRLGKYGGNVYEINMFLSVIIKGPTVQVRIVLKNQSFVNPNISLIKQDTMLFVVSFFMYNFILNVLYDSCSKTPKFPKLFI